MVHGAPDNFQVKPTNITYSLQDDAELAVRLGAASSIDRLGNVIFFDDFSDGKEAFYTKAVGTGAEIAISSQYFKHSGFSLMLKSGDDITDTALAVVYLSGPKPSKTGIETCFSFNSNVDHILFIVRGDTETLHFYAGIELDLINDKLQYRDSGEVYQDIAPLRWVTVHFNMFHILKLVIDPVTGYYVRLIFDNIIYDLSSYNFATEAASDYPRLFPKVEVYSKNGVNGTVYLDNVIITRNEP